MEEMFIKTSDNTKIALNLYKNGNDSAIIIVHGWFMSKDSAPFKNLAQMLCENFDIISMDCRGHGKSSGKFTFTIKEQSDLHTVVKYAKKYYKRIFLLGFSLGGALVLLHAARFNDIDAVIAVSPPAYFENIENHFWHPRAFIPTIQKFEPKTWFSVRADLHSLLFCKKPAPANAIENIKVPVLFIAGENDPTVGLWHTQELYEKAKCIKKLEVIKNGIHAEDLFLADKTGFVKTCSEWFDNLYAHC